MGEELRRATLCRFRPSVRHSLEPDAGSAALTSSTCTARVLAVGVRGGHGLTRLAVPPSREVRENMQVLPLDRVYSCEHVLFGYRRHS